MQYMFVFVVVFLIMAAVTALFFWMIRNIALDVKAQVRSTFLRQLEVFDQLYEEKTSQLVQARREYERFQSNIMPRQDLMRQTKAASSGSVPMQMSDIPAASLIRGNFARDYRLVREKFDIDIQEVWKEAGIRKKQAPADQLKYRDTLAALLDKLSFEVVCQLSSFPENVQETLLRECFTEEENKILAAYLAQTDNLDIISFCDWLRGEAAFCDPNPVVIQNPAACEGIRLLQSGKIYDYSI